MTTEVQSWWASIPLELADQLRAAYHDGLIKPVNALAELRMAKVVLPSGIDEFDIGQWLRLTS